MIEPIQGAKRSADLVLDPAAGGAALSCYKEKVKLVMAHPSLSAFARSHVFRKIRARVDPGQSIRHAREHPWSGSLLSQIAEDLAGYLYTGKWRMTRRKILLIDPGNEYRVTNLPSNTPIRGPVNGGEPC